MKLSSLFNSDKTILSFEVFPPKKTSPIETVYSTLAELKELNPAFISVTYGAGGNAADTTTCDIAAYIQRELGIPSAAHLTCVYSTKEAVLTQLQQFKERGVENILALRGDVNPEIPRLHEFEYASDLTKFIKENGDFHVSGACYPECHLEAASLAEDIKHLKIKVEAGAEHLMSQLFFDNDTFHRFREMADIVGINVPIEAGIMPVVNKKQIERMVSMCGASLPPKFAKMMQRYEHNPEALRDAGIAYAVDQIVDLISNGVDGIHLYTMNNPYVARKISEAVRSLL
ncbi:MAG: methylenetetrahydrofolate reductase [NAD(P)H] [Oscillospiraceae bacterium]|nr:methylenetetrahydrofolate reductase [NAD(P)H] [Oscillospiraceae bacterium]